MKRNLQVSKKKPLEWEAVPESEQTWDDAWGKHKWDPKKGTITTEYADLKPVSSLIKRKYRGG